MRLRIIQNDLFNITGRIREIDSGYYLVRNLEKKRFEVHFRRAHDTLELVVPYKELDVRTLTLILKSKIENRQKLLAEMELSNEKLETDAKRQLKDSLIEQYKEKRSLV